MEEWRRSWPDATVSGELNLSRHPVQVSPFVGNPESLAIGKLHVVIMSLCVDLSSLCKRNISGDSRFGTVNFE